MAATRAYRDGCHPQYDEETFMSASYHLHVDSLCCVHEQPVASINFSLRRMYHEAVTHNQSIGRLSVVIDIRWIGHES